MQRALELRDLVDEIISWLPAAGLAVAIRVNKLWFQASKPLLWETINLCHALQLLGSWIKFSDEELYRLAGPIDISNWERFHLYCRHVRVLQGNGADSDALVQAIGLHSSLPWNSHKSSYLFPACRELRWHAAGYHIEISGFNALVTPTIDHVYLVGYSTVEHQWLHNFCKTLAAGLSRLDVLCIEYDRQCTNSEQLDAFYELLAQFALTLSHVQISGTLFTPATIECLLKIPNLHRLVVTHSGRQPNPSNQVTNYDVDSHKLVEFASLEGLTFASFISQPFVFKLFQQATFVALTSLQWHIYHVKTGVDAFLMRIPTVCPNLETLAFGAANMPKTDTVQWSLVRSLLNCKKLNSLSLCCVKVDMTLNNLAELLRSRGSGEHTPWSVVEVFSVRPFHLNEAFGLFAKYSRNILRVGFHVHDKGGIQPFSSIPATTLPLYLLDKDADIKAYLQTHCQLANEIRKTGLFFPHLSDINFGDSSFMPDSVGTIASLLLAICERPMATMAYDLEYMYKMDDHLAIFYVETRKLMKQPMPPNVSRFLEIYKRCKTARDSES